MIPKMLLAMQSQQTIAYVKYAFACFSLMLPIQTFAEPANAKWLLVKQKEHVSLHTTKDKSGYVWLKASVLVHGQPNDFLTLLDNTDIAASWIDNCEKVEILTTSSTTEKIVRTTFNAPWPVKNREMITQSFTEIDPQSQTIRIRIEDYSEHYPPRPSYVQMQNVKGNWLIQSTGTNKMKIEYIGYGEPSGNIPIWLANKLALSSMFKTFRNLGETLGAPPSPNH
ncbi:START domain-containing protein [Aliiglaciecola sp. 3_MG-2023]|uniref:START domain-containing protein n=1 Tax=Aliiglaciecola sp. 3_MG-2023 TaxID=3062644 RepID=UPI0026E24E6A|nr:START domain-containing protein [Aliiglaciecola sp. 3_MG-2023]MDO6693350.1 START domain-containing protein [Aliiglaciecola sp. 3_MG-2023]